MARTSTKAAESAPLIDPWERLSPKVRHGVCIAILLLLPTFLFPSVFWGDQRFIAHDTLQWRASAESVIEAREATGEEPLWASDQFAGMPAYLVSYQKMVPNLDQLFALPETLYPANFFWILLPGMYFFMISLGFRPLTSLLGAVLAGFSTYLPIIIGAGHNSKFVAMSFAPWVLLGYNLVRSQKNPWMSAFAFSLAFVLHLRAGHPQITYYLLWILGIWFIVDLISAAKEGKARSFAGVGAMVAIAAVITLVANAQPYWSIYEYSPYSVRGGGGGPTSGESGLDIGYAFLWSQGLGELLTLLIPNAYGGSEAYWGPKSGTAGPHYFGAFTILFLLIGLWKSSFRLKWVFFGAGLVAVLFALGDSMMALNRFMFNYFPLFNKFRAPETWLVVTGICFPVVAMAGVEYLMDRANALTAKDWVPAVAPVALLAVAFALGSNSLLSFDKPGQAYQFAQQLAQANNVAPSDPRVSQQVNEYINSTLKPERRKLASDDSLRFLLLTLGGVAVVFGLSIRKLSPGPATLILVVIAGYDMLTVGQRYANENSMAPKSFDAAAAVEQNRRPVDTWLEQNSQGDASWPWRVFPLAESPFNNALPSYFYASLGGYSGARMALYDDLMDGAFFTSDGGLNNGLLSMLNTKYLTYSPNVDIPGWEQVYADQSGAVYENGSVLPKAWFAQRVNSVNSRDQAMATLMTSSFNPATDAFVAKEPTQSLSNADSAATATVTEYGPRRIRIETDRSNGPGLLVISEMYYPAGWTATVAGRPAEILQTNHVLRGVEVPAGRHEVVLEFNPRSHTLGTTLAWIGHAMLLLLAGMAFYSYQRDKKADSDG